jgi:hypothetical protein
MDLIQKMEIRLPAKHRRNQEAYPGVFLKFLKEKPPNLFELILKTNFWHSGNTVVGDRVKSRTGKEYRAMLHTSAWITCRQSLLKKAIWVVESGGVYLTTSQMTIILRLMPKLVLRKILKFLWKCLGHLSMMVRRMQA